MGIKAWDLINTLDRHYTGCNRNIERRGQMGVEVN
jgi:hypothetical protein